MATCIAPANTKIANLTNIVFADIITHPFAVSYLAHCRQLHRHFTGDNLSARTVSDKLNPVHFFLSTGYSEQSNLWGGSTCSFAPTNKWNVVPEHFGA